jgi:hypothetical protein
MPLSKIDSDSLNSPIEVSGNATTATTAGSAATLTTGRTIAITGDLAYTSPSFNGSTNVTAAGTLATVNANVGSFTNASVTVNAKGLVTAASSGAAAGTVTSVSGTGTVSGLTLSGTVTTSGSLTLGGTISTLNQNTTGSSGSVTGNATGSTFGFNSGFGSVATAYGCRAWVNFNGTGTVAIRASGNVSSITDNGTGDYTVNFTTAMPDANYNAVGISNDGSGGSTSVSGVFTYGTTTFRFQTVDCSGNADVDCANVNISIFR